MWQGLGMKIRESVPKDREVLQKLCLAAFPDEPLWPLVTALLEWEGVRSLVAEQSGSVLGHGLFTPCEVTGYEAPVALLGPLAVIPDRQRDGIGSRLIEAGIDQLTKAGFSHLFVLGDPAYYGRFGFQPDERVAPPYALPEAWAWAWRSLPLSRDVPSLTSTLSVPTPWQDAGFWQE